MPGSKSDKDLLIAHQLRRLVTAYPHNKLSEATVDLYITKLRDYPVNSVSYAVERCLESSDEFFPTFGKLKERIDYWLMLRADFSILPEKAFDEVVIEVKSFDPGRGPRFSNSAMREAVDIIGIGQLMANPLACRTDFIALYKKLAHDHFDEITKSGTPRPKELTS